MLDVSPNLLKVIFDPSIAPPVIGQGVNPFDYVPYLPQPGKQTDFFECDADIVIYGGSVAGGKSILALLKALKGAETPGYVATIFRRTAKDIQAKGGLWDKTKDLYGAIPGALYRDSTQFLDWRFASGSSISFAHSDNLFTAKLGAEMCYVGVDEIANEWTEKEFLFLLSRNRSDCGVKTQFVGTCNPNCESFLIKNEKKQTWKEGTWLEWWIDDDGFPIQERSGVIRYFLRYNDTLYWADSKAELLEQHADMVAEVQSDSVPVENLIKSFTFIGANVYDNPIFLEKNPGYLANILMMDEVDRQRFLFGNWKVSDQVGIIFNPNNFQYCQMSEVPDGIDIRFWDFAGKEELQTNAQSCFTASQKWRFVPTGKDLFDVYIMHVFWEQTLDADTAVELAIEDGREVPISWELEPGSASLKYASLLTKELKRSVRGIQTFPLKPQSDKVARAKPWSHLAKLGRVYIVRNSHWNPTLKNALIRFDGTKQTLVNDIIDAGSGCLQWYIDTYRKGNIPVTGKEKYKKV